MNAPAVASLFFILFHLTSNTLFAAWKVIVINPVSVHYHRHFCLPFLLIFYSRNFISKAWNEIKNKNPFYVSVVRNVYREHSLTCYLFHFYYIGTRNGILISLKESFKLKIFSLLSHMHIHSGVDWYTTATATTVTTTTTGWQTSNNSPLSLASYHQIEIGLKINKKKRKFGILFSVFLVVVVCISSCFSLFTARHCFTFPLLLLWFPDTQRENTKEQNDFFLFICWFRWFEKLFSNHFIQQSKRISE